MGYLERYNHSVTITDQRILNIDESKVIFIAKDYRTRADKKQVILDGTEFLRRFIQYILLPGISNILHL
ncbi:MAG: transposase [Tangfeifania sp.]